jgi:NitT/TauT family transport system substrate-binding protein
MFMKRPYILLIAFVVALLLLLGWRYWSTRTPPGPETSTDLYLGWIFSGAYAGDALATSSFAKDNGLVIHVHGGGQGLDPIKLVNDGSFGIASSDDVLRAIDRGADLVIVGVINDLSPACFIALQQSGITKPADLVGKRVGVLPFGSTQWVYRSLLKHNNIRRESITEVTVGPDLKSFLLANSHDVHPAYVYDETVTLDREGVKYNIIRPSDWGVRFKGPVYFTTRTTVDKSPQLVTAFIRSTISGWKAANQDPQSAIQALTKLAPTVDPSRELEVLKRGLPLYVETSRPLLYSDPKTWGEMIRDLVEYGFLSKPIDPEKVIDMRFVTNAHGQSF